ncbi:hypothetical protein [Apibacter adventoris]|uniref:hypothetical protein n=1 Tax=Apibacter adventoris TaxID=1679466 RepID=UPI000CF68CA7|nr:hypothetical protein [Apibacter adventoris]PQL95912.1 hypothetical protein C4S76_01745 [Apibacter adventoris]
MEEYVRFDLQKEWQNKILKSFAKEHRKIITTKSKEKDDAVNYKYTENGYKTKLNAPKQD